MAGPALCFKCQVENGGVQNNTALGRQVLDQVAQGARVEVFFIQISYRTRFDAQTVKFSVGVSTDHNDPRLAGNRLDAAGAQDAILFPQHDIHERQLGLQALCDPHGGVAVLGLVKVGVRLNFTKHPLELLQVAVIVVDQQDGNPMDVKRFVGALQGQFVTRDPQHFGVLADVINSFQTAVYTQLPVHACQVVLHGLDTQVQVQGDSLVIQPILEQPQDIALAQGQGRWRGIWTGTPHELGYQRARNPAFALQHALQGQLQVAQGLILEMVAVYPSLEQLVDVKFVVVHADHQDFYRRVEGADFGQGLKWVEFGHTDVDQDAIGLVGMQACQQGRTVINFGDYFQIFDLFHNRPDACPDNCMVISD